MIQNLEKKEHIEFTTYKKRVYVFLVLGVTTFCILLTQVNLLAGMAFSMLPIGLIIFFKMIKRPYWLLMTAFILNYFLMGIARYVPIPSIGMMADGLFLLTIVTLMLYSCIYKINWKVTLNEYTFAAVVWLIYCYLEVINPYSSFQSWSTSIRFMAIYGVYIAILTPMVFNSYKDLKLIVFLWSVFTMLAFIKALCQKTFGWDYAEFRWLFVEGKASTHILGSGIRYFSFFSDAANFGSGMGMSMVTFLIIGFNAKKLKWKIYYLIVGLCAGQAMMISGTRSAMIIPFAGFAFYIMFSRNFKVVLIGSVFVLLAYMFFAMTLIGQGNAQIRRMRSAFNSKQDPSYNLRKQNQQKIRAFMADKPFGVGVGMGGGKSAGSNDLLTSQIATDSWTVVLWEETGIVGLLLYIALFLYLQLKGAYIVFFKIKDEQLKYLLGGWLAGIFGIMVSSYSNEIIAQFPNGIVIFFGQAFVFMAIRFDEEIRKEKMLTAKPI